MFCFLNSLHFFLDDVIDVFFPLSYRTVTNFHYESFIFWPSICKWFCCRCFFFSYTVKSKSFEMFIHIFCWGFLDCFFLIFCLPFSTFMTVPTFIYLSLTCLFSDRNFFSSIIIHRCLDFVLFNNLCAYQQPQENSLKI